MSFLRGLGYFVLGWVICSAISSIAIGAVGAHGTSVGDSAQLLAALTGGIAIVLYKRKN